MLPQSQAGIMHMLAYPDFYFLCSITFPHTNADYLVTIFFFIKKAMQYEYANIL